MAVHVVEVELHERVQQVARREDALGEHGEVVLDEGLQPLPVAAHTRSIRR